MDWETFSKETERLAEKIDYKPDCIMAIARGGVIPSVLISQYLKNKNMYVLSVQGSGLYRVVSADVFVRVEGKKVLLVEDMQETGKTMEIVKDFLEKKGAEVKTASLYIMPKTRVEPDYFLKVKDKVVHFPWEK